jgi:hypothetical protein
LGLASGHDALYESTVGEGKLRLLFDFMGRMVPIDVDQRDVFGIATVRKRKRKRTGQSSTLEVKDNRGSNPISF